MMFMNARAWSRANTRRWLCLLGSVAMSGSAAAGTLLDVETYWSAEETAEFSFHAGDRELGRFSGKGRDGESSKGSCRLDLPDGTEVLTLRGRLVKSSSALFGRKKTQTIEGHVDFRVRDASPLLDALRDTTRPVAERWRRTLEAEKAFTEAMDLFSVLDVGERATAAEVDAAEKRLGFALPATYRDLVTGLGPLQVGDSYVPGPDHLQTAAETVLEDWSYGEEGIPSWMSPRALERFRRAVILFVDVGDGVGGAFFLAPTNAACGDRFASTFFHEEYLSEAAADIANDNLTCESFDEALTERAGYLVIDAHESNLTDRGEILIDFSSPEQKLVLRYFVAGEDEHLEATLTRQ